MTPVLELRTPIPVETPLGKAHALFVEIDNHVQYWTVIIDANSAFVTFPQSRIRAQKSYTHGRGISDETMSKIIALKEAAPT